MRFSFNPHNNPINEVWKMKKYTLKRAEFDHSHVLTVTAVSSEYRSVHLKI